ncbi:hypothetical protein MKX03_035451 [Papaver bracteatum]|nr:hypothetical protein MKX03_035451 [Papaver bracteatum]
MQEEREARLRVEAELSYCVTNEASIYTHEKNSAGSSPKIVKDSEHKGVNDEIIQTKRNIGIGKGKSCIMCLDSSGSSVVEAKGKVFCSKSSDMLHNVRIGKENVCVLV